MAIGNVVVGIDFSELSSPVASRAVWLPMARGAVVTLVHVVPPRLPGKLDSLLRSAAASRLATVQSALATELERADKTHVEVRAVVDSGAPAEALTSQALKTRAELVVVGRGEHTRLGSTSERVVRLADSSVLVVTRPPSAAYAQPLVGVDLSPLSPTVLAAAYRLVDRAHAIDVVHAYPPAVGA
jgi:nucleotide-binding universal stress UspA family protein